MSISSLEPTPVNVAAGTVFIFTVFFLLRSHFKSRAKVSSQYLPPGPTPAESADVWNERPFLKFTEWSKTYGEIFAFQALGETTVVLSTPRMVADVMDRQGVITGGRPNMVLSNKATDYRFAPHLGSETPVWKRMSRAYKALFTNESLAKYTPVQYRESVRLCKDLLDDPEHFIDHALRTVMSAIYSIVYGIYVPHYSSPEVLQWKEYGDAELELVNYDLQYSSSLRQYLPILFAPWRKAYHTYRKARIVLFTGLRDRFQKRQGIMEGSYMEYLTENQKAMGIEDDDLMYIAAGLVEGNECTGLYIQSLIAHLLTFPEVQTKAQEEIDRVLGSENRVPTLDDLDNLPYIRGLILEHHRYRPVFPYAFPHYATEDTAATTKDGRSFVIPKGAQILMSTWAINRSEELYDEPDVFNPDRFMKDPNGTKKGADLTDFKLHFLFGAGRRKCPGQVMARQMVAHMTMHIIWAFNFLPSKDEDPKKTDVRNLDNFEEGMSSIAKAFKCEIVPRNPARTALIREEAARLDSLMN